MDVNKDTGEFEVLPAIAPSALEAQTRGEIDIQVATAKRYPRSITKFKHEVESLALLDQETAEACIYALPRDGKSVEGPSARFAEIVASCWGHMRIQTRVAGEDDHFVTVTGIAWDLERNVAKSADVRRRITKKNGQRFNDDMIVVTSNAAGSIASRNAVLQTVPRAYWWPTYQACRKAAVGDQKTLAVRRAGALAHFQKMGIDPARVFALLGVAGEDDVTSEHVLQLLGLATAIREGDTNIDEAFPAASGSSVIQMPQRKQTAAPEPTVPPAASRPAEPPATSEPAPSNGGPAPEQQQAPATAAATASVPASTTPQPNGNGHTVKPLDYRGQAVKILRVWRPNPQKNGHLVETSDGLALAYHNGVIKALGDAAKANVPVRLTVLPTNYPPAPFKIENVLLALEPLAKAVLPTMPSAGDVFGNGEREAGQEG